MSAPCWRPPAPWRVGAGPERESSPACTRSGTPIDGAPAPCASGVRHRELRRRAGMPKSRRRKPRISAIVNSHRSILDAISQNGMIGALPLMSAREFIERGLVRPLPGFELEIPLYLVHPQSEYMPRKNLALKQHLLRRCKEHRESL
ncbi:MAG: hypothetical protein EBQ99_06800 [Planctomycetes bacterium]|nr:hypothetical protein [Planctomycetota bacterium]